MSGWGGANAVEQFRTFEIIRWRPMMIARVIIVIIA